MAIVNQPAHTDDPVINKLRNAIIHRALWMGFILKEAMERGLDWEQLGREAIFKVGCIHGDGIKERMDAPDSLVSFAQTFFTEDIKKIFEIKVAKLTEEVVELEYGYCPLLVAWQQIGFEGKLLETLCEIAMCGDHGIKSRFDWIDFSLGKTIAQGHHPCELTFRRKPKLS